MHRAEDQAVQGWCDEQASQGATQRESAGDQRLGLSLPDFRIRASCVSSFGMGLSWHMPFVRVNGFRIPGFVVFSVVACPSRKTRTFRLIALEFKIIIWRSSLVHSKSCLPLHRCSTPGVSLSSRFWYVGEVILLVSMFHYPRNPVHSRVRCRDVPVG